MNFDGPVWIQAKQVSKYFEDNIMASYTIREADQIEHKIVYNYPLTAFEELATNAILHKEYDTPELKFYPDNEEDNYTNAVIGINKEFLNEFNSSSYEKTTTKTTTKTTIKQEEIIKIIAENPHISANEMAEKLNLTVDGVRYHLNKMRKAGLIRYEGSTKLGQWVIMKLNSK